MNRGTALGEKLLWRGCFGNNAGPISWRFVVHFARFVWPSFRFVLRKHCVKQRLLGETNGTTIACGNLLNLKRVINFHHRYFSLQASIYLSFANKTLQLLKRN